MFWLVTYADGCQLEMVGALSASLDHHCPSGFLCRAESNGLFAQPWLWNGTAETGGVNNSWYLLSNACEDSSHFDAEAFGSLLSGLSVGLPTGSQLQNTLTGVGLPAQLRVPPLFLLAQLGLGLVWKLLGYVSSLCAPQPGPQTEATTFPASVPHARQSRRRVVIRCRRVGKARRKHPRMICRARTRMLRFRRMHYWSLGRLPGRSW